MYCTYFLYLHLRAHRRAESGPRASRPRRDKRTQVRRAKSNLRPTAEPIAIQSVTTND